MPRPPDRTFPPGPPHPPGPPPGPPHDDGGGCRPRIPDQFEEKALASELGARMRGTAADGATRLDAHAAPPKVIWVDRGDEVLVHLDSTAVRVLDQLILVSVDLETDQTGRTPLVVALAVGDGTTPGGMIATTDALPRGDGRLAARWGRSLQDAVWASLHALASDHADERGAAPRGLAARQGRLELVAGTPLAARAVLGTTR